MCVTIFCLEHLEVVVCVSLCRSLEVCLSLVCGIDVPSFFFLLFLHFSAGLPSDIR